MALKDIVIASREISVGDTSFTVRGITVSDIVGMLGKYSKEMGQLMDNSKDIMDIAKESPEFVSVVIATAAGEPEMAETVASLPLGIQTKALSAIWDMTQLEADELGNLLGGIMTLLQKLNTLLPSTVLVQKDSKDS